LTTLKVQRWLESSVIFAKLKLKWTEENGKKLTVVVKNGDKISFAYFWVWRKLKLVGQNLAKELIIFCTKSGLLSKRGLQKKEKENSDSDTILAEILCWNDSIKDWMCALIFFAIG